MSRTAASHYQLETQDDIEHEVSLSLAPFVPESCGCHTSRKTASVRRAEQLGSVSDDAEKNERTCYEQ